MANESAVSTGLSNGMSIPDAVARLDVLIRNTTSNVLAFVVFQQVAERVAIIDALRGKLSVQVSEFMLSPEKCDPFEFLADVPPEPRQCIVFTEIENALAARTDDDKPKLAGFVNLQRERLLEIPHAVIFLVRQYGFREIATHAPDFFHWSSGTFEIFSELPSPTSPIIQNLLGSDEFQSREDAEQKARLYRELIADYKKAGVKNDRFIAELYLKWGNALVWLGDIKVAREKYERSLYFFETIRDLKGKSETLHALAMLDAQQGRVEQARARYEESLAIKKSLGDLQGRSVVLHNLAVLDAQQGQVEQARARYEESLTISESLGNLKGKGATMHALAVLDAQQELVDQARARYEESLKLFESIGDLQGKSETLLRLAMLDAQQGRVEQAGIRYEEALAIKEFIGDLRGKSATLYGLANLNLQQAKIKQARERYKESLTIRESIGDVFGVACALTMLGQMDAENGDFGQSLGALKQAEEIFTKLGAPEAKQVREIARQIQVRSIANLFSKGRPHN